ncbi:GAF and ANTAR domain-containing protein [Candidatus Mycobacterium wuenschmannii]|uniref:GAF and ANTAR domain-containing protein n=1 Tax=Candidatus Mycobacterium wuenschmannii TaxID=3027808 RepID=A0ABY8VUN8_9MYCO|nr:GAF and ANTAR domain-containing protein [Candidatus Mycobacterium wuenschmannii]WIM85867.1 GAF and ANTAR domain-containing protein [Candidatus Mycobacterium wuenschmannii]
MTHQSGGLIREVADLVQDLQHKKHVELDDVLAELTNTAVEVMPGAQYAGITLTSRDGKVQSASATDRYPELLDEIQQRHAQGPCLSAAWEHHTVRIDDMTREERWPLYCKEAVAETPIRSIIAFQLFADHNHMGALNFYAQTPGAFDDDAAETGYLLATHAAVAWNIVRRDEQFRSALASRDIIGQAKGMIMERFTIDAIQAFELLKRLSQSSNTPLTEVARKLVESERS